MKCTFGWPGRSQRPHRSAAAKRPQTLPNRHPAHAAALRPRPEPPAGQLPARALWPASLGWPGRSGCWRRPGARVAAQPAAVQKALSWHCMKPAKSTRASTDDASPRNAQLVLQSSKTCDTLAAHRVCPGAGSSPLPLPLGRPKTARCCCWWTASNKINCVKFLALAALLNRLRAGLSAA